MKRFLHCTLALGFASGLFWLATYPSPVASSPVRARSTDPREMLDELVPWPWFEEVSPQDTSQARYFDFPVGPSVFDKALPDLRDLRLFDTSGREVPFALRVRRTENHQTDLKLLGPFNKVVAEDGSAEFTVELKADEGLLEHNEIEIPTEGANFRRRVKLEGSDTGTPQGWRSLMEKGYLVEYDVAPRLIVIRKLSYPASRYRFLRVHVYPDASNPDDKVKIGQVAVRRSTQLAGNYVTLPANLGPREPVRGDGGPGSAWTIDFGGETAPCERLSFDVADSEFARSYRLEVANPDETRQVIARGDWRRRPGSEWKPLEIEFPEVVARRLRLVITDFANPPLNVMSATYTAPARQVIFASSEDLVWPLRLYFGNPKAFVPEYDFAKNLPVLIEPAPISVQLGPRTANPTYRPPPKKWTERWAGLVYVVLGFAGAVLLGILWILARQAMARHDAGRVGAVPSA